MEDRPSHVERVRDACESPDGGSCSKRGFFMWSVPPIGMIIDRSLPEGQGSELCTLAPGKEERGFLPVMMIAYEGEESAAGAMTIGAPGGRGLCRHRVVRRPSVFRRNGKVLENTDSLEKAEGARQGG